MAYSPSPTLFQRSALLPVSERSRSSGKQLKIGSGSGILHQNTGHLKQCFPAYAWKVPTTYCPFLKLLDPMRIPLCSRNSEMLSMDTVVVFDFDLTIIDCDSDPWVMEKLGVTELFESLLSTLPWNTAMDKMMGELHEQGKTISDIEASLRTIPLYPETIRAIKFAFSVGCDLRIVSDANLFFIKTILETHDLLQYFTEIKANPAFVEENGRLRICPYHPFTVAPHGCNLCPPNMCKGAIIEGMRNSIEDGFNKRFIYLGDGSGDFCPTLKLTERDDVLPRKEYPLWKLIEKNPGMVKAKVHGWSNAKDVEDLLMKLLKPC